MPNAIIITDLGYGDAGKGSTIDALSRRLASPTVIVRHHGGPQAAHNVITPEGLHHTFAQFGSGMFVPTTTTHLSQFMLVNPITLMAEAAHLDSLGVPWQERLTISENARVITPYHRQLNKMREAARGRDRHGSTGHGVGETMQQDILRPDLTLLTGNITRKRVEHLRDYCLDQARVIGTPNPSLLDLFSDDVVLEDFLSAARVAFAGRLRDDYWLNAHFETHELIFEGSQGVLLDEWHGFHPYTTWSTTTPDNAHELLVNYPGKVTTMGLMRSYMTRHGDGPFVTEADVDFGDEPHNTDGPWTGPWRVGRPDLVAYKYAVKVSKTIDVLGMTFVDRIPPEGQRVATAYDMDGTFVDELPVYDRDLPAQEVLTNRLFKAKPIYQKLIPAQRYPRWMSEQLGLPLRMLSSGPRATDKQWFS